MTDTTADPREFARRHRSTWSIESAFCEEFMPGGKWRLHGYDLIEAVEAWAEQHPEHVHIVACDDSSFMTSDLVMIECRDGDQQWMGTSVYYLPQCADEVAWFFLYPGHVLALLHVLTDLDIKARTMADPLRRMLFAAYDKRRVKPVVGVDGTGSACAGG